MKTRIPVILIFSRLIGGLIILTLSIIQVANYKEIAVTLLTLGLLSDILDGIIARRLNVSTQKLRRMDSSVDQVFFLSVAVATYLQCPDFFRENAIPLTILLGLEGLTYVICFLKFRKEIATHSIGAKIWTLFLFATLVQVILHCQSTLLFAIFIWLGLLTRLEIIAIILTLKSWTNDVPTVYHSLKLRQGKQIKRHKIFNG